MQMKMPKFQLAHLGSGRQPHQYKSIENKNIAKMRLTLISFAVRTRLITFQFQETLDRLCVLRSALSSRIGRPS
jgi:hypothetical protein